MDKHSIVIGCLVLVVLSAGILAYALRDRKVSIEQYSSIERPAGIHPDYCEIVVPPNIAPLNFVVLEDGSYYCVRISSKKGEQIEIFSRSPKIMIPQGPWHELLKVNKGEQLSFDVFVKTTNDSWQRFQTINNKIAREDIDGFLVYRRIHPGYSTWGKMGVYQRNLQNYDEKLILNNRYYGDGCLNCHTFCLNHPDKMLIGIRSSIYGSSELLVDEGAAKKVGTKFGYTSWHPSGRLATYSINKIRLFFHSAKNEVRGVTDLDSLLAYYLVDSKTIKTSPQFSNKERLETYPTWSPDGRYLYFCSAPVLWSQRDTVPQENYDQVKYDLVRVSYDLDRDEWGELETVLSAKDTGLTILLPRVSPDGRWLLFCMCEYGSFPVYYDSSDLYLIDLKDFDQTGRAEPQRLQINSDKSESWHSWSGNSRWIAFSSKRQSGVFTRSYLSYVDESGRAYKPLLLPQKDPTYYDSCLWTYSVPELITETVPVTGEKLGRVIRGSRKISVDLPITMATPRPGVLPGRREPWKERE
ncbi:MAG: TolB family protein [Planctomycetota bacterium]|jgi:hypothetical protein